MSEKILKRVFVTKPVIGFVQPIYADNFYGQSFTVCAVSDVKKDLLGREFYEVMLEKNEPEPPKEIEETAPPDQIV